MKLDLPAAVSVARTHPYLQDVVDHHIIRRLISNCILKISDSSHMTCDADNTRVDFETILYIFNHFGHQINKLNIHFIPSVNERQLKMLNKCITKYGSISLERIDFNFINFTYLDVSNHRFAYLEGPFLNVEHVRFQGRVVWPNLNEIFPSLRSLDIEAADVDAQYLMENFPKLEYLKTPGPQYWRDNLSPYFIRIFKSNPQLKHLKIPRIYYDTLQLLNETLPDLESFETDNFFFAIRFKLYESLHFNNMKKFACRDTILWGPSGIDHMRRNPLKFGNLDEIEFDNKDLVDQWFGIVMENKNLRKIIANDALSDQQLEEIASGLEKLEEFSMDCNGDSNASKKLVQFMDKAKQLKRISFLNMNKVGSLGSDRCLGIAEQISNEWKIVGDNEKNCSFIRDLLI